MDDDIALHRHYTKSHRITLLVR